MREPSALPTITKDGDKQGLDPTDISELVAAAPKLCCQTSAPEAVFSAYTYPSVEGMYTIPSSFRTGDDTMAPDVGTLHNKLPDATLRPYT
jgi:hypothetical protein